MHTVYGMLGQSSQLFSFTGKPLEVYVVSTHIANTDRFLLKDAQDDMAGARLKQ